MTTLETGAENYAAAHPKDPDGKPWTNQCGRLMWDFNASFTPGWATPGNVSTAAHAMSGSTLFYPVSYDDILPGRFVWMALGPDGHVGQVVSGQGLDALVFWASDALTVKLGDHIGFGTVRNYIAVKKSKLLGVSEDYAGALPNLSAFTGVTPVPQPVRRPSMSTIYYTTSNNKKTGSANLWALAGDGAGTAAWLETAGQDVANDWAAVHGHAVFLTTASYNSFKARYLAGWPTVNVDTAALAAALVKLLPAAGVTPAQVTSAVEAGAKEVIAAIPTAAENGAAARTAIVK